jgi:hypothetical protein
MSDRTIDLIVIPALPPVIEPDPVVLGNRFHWALPFWLPPVTGINALLFASFAHPFPNPNIPNILNPSNASKTALEIWANLFNLSRFPLEPDESLRLRVTATLTMRGNDLLALEQYLTKFAGTSVKLADRENPASPVLLDGSHALDGSWQLGGIGGDDLPGEYTVILPLASIIPHDWILSELHRLRPMGLKPKPMTILEFTGGIFNSLGGILEITPL